MTVTPSKISWSLVVAASSDELLQANLLRSEETNSAKEIIVQRYAPNISVAYNTGLDKCTGDVVVFVHQDVFLPTGWAKKLCESIRLLTMRDPHWGVAGVYGVTDSGRGAGYIYSTGLHRLVGEPFSEPIQIRSLDEMLLIVRPSANLRFDERLPGFHLYGTDICLEAEARGMKNYVLPCFALHNSNGVKHLPLSFWQAYIYLRRKWRSRLPIVTPCTEITPSCAPMFKDIIGRVFRRILGRNNPGSRVSDPARLYAEDLVHVAEKIRTKHSSGCFVNDKAPKKLRVLLLGATFQTKNMGVSALTEGAIRCIINQWPGAEIFLLDYGLTRSNYSLEIDGKTVKVQLLNLRFSKKFYLKNNVGFLLLVSLLSKLIPSQPIRKRFLSKNPYLKRMLESKLAVSVAGGDSFSDIYGLMRLLYVSLPQLLVLSLDKKLVLLPQTLGPFRGQLAKSIAGYIMRHAYKVYSRDFESLEEVKRFFRRDACDNKLSFCYDVGFLVEPRRPIALNVEKACDLKRKGHTLIGLNISGLLFMGGYSGSNMFGLRVDYRELVHDIVMWFLRRNYTDVLLVPHVFGNEAHAESDSTACRRVYEDLYNEHTDRLLLVKGNYDHREIKYIIGMCDFFVGSRMHACIGALSQYIPAVGIAYSRKFYGVFESIGVESLVADPRTMGKKEILSIIDEAYEHRTSLKEKLQQTIPHVKETVLNLFSVL